ncbi:MAG: CotH kinase family protein [Bacteroidales bacterium]|jgi:hypothetical protein|nr:CotH kinase family protein [Bacteroidales bacterium]
MKRSVFIIITFLLYFSYFVRAQIVINELMQSNIDIVRDDLQEFPDSWIELYNTSDTEVDIRNWTISDNADYKQGWKITTSVKIQPHAYCLLYADKEAKGLHTNFRIDSGKGGSVYVFNANNVQIDAVLNIPKQPAPNIAWGRVSDAGALWVNFVAATPGRANVGKTSNRLLPPPVFSLKGGMFANAVKVQLSLPTGVPTEVTLAHIHYTTDNSEPTAASPVYSGAISIVKTTVLRAKIMHPDYLNDYSQAHTYIISERDFPLPVISISVDTSYLWNDEFGIYCAGNGTHGVEGLGTDYPVNWNNNWRRPINFEYFPQGSTMSALNQLCEMRIAGGWSRSNAQKTFVLYANKRFGEKRFNYDFFAEKPRQEIKSFMLRNSGNDFWYTHFRDAAIQLFFGGKTDVDYQAYQPAILFLNGNYWGIQNLRERSDEDFVLANYATENVDVVENWWDVKAGDDKAINQLRSEVRKSAAQRNSEWIMNQIDVDEFINYMILQMYVANTDFLSDYNNNIAMWRHRNSAGKWRFILKDTDQGLGIWNANAVTHNALSIQYDNDTWRLFTALLSQESFKKKFYRRYAVYMGDLLHYQSTAHIIDSIATLIEPAMPEHLEFWQHHNYTQYGIPHMWWRDLRSWQQEVDNMKQWCAGRNNEVYKQLRAYFNLGATMNLVYESPNDAAKTPAVYINGVSMRPSGLQASYFQNEDIELNYAGNAALYGWKITKTVNGVSSVETYFRQTMLYNVPIGCTSVKIKLIDNPTTIENPAEVPIVIRAVAEGVKISNLMAQSKIAVYDMSGKVIAETSTNDYSVLIPMLHKGVFVVHVSNEKQRTVQKIVN